MSRQVAFFVNEPLLFKCCTQFSYSFATHHSWAIFVYFTYLLCRGRLFHLLLFFHSTVPNASCPFTSVYSSYCHQSKCKRNSKCSRNSTARLANLSPGLQWKRKQSKAKCCWNLHASLCSQVHSTGSSTVHRRFRSSAVHSHGDNSSIQRFIFHCPYGVHNKPFLHFLSCSLIPFLFVTPQTQPCTLVP